MKATTSTQPPVTVKFAAQRLGLSVRTVLRLVNSGAIKAQKFGDGATSAWQVDAEDLERFAAERGVDE